MGRKKRKVAEDEDGPSTSEVPPPPPPPLVESQSPEAETTTVKLDEAKDKAKSNYAMSSHSGDLVEEDIYVSDGSEDEEDNVEIVLSGSKMGLMRRGIATLGLVQPNLRQWTKQSDTAEGETEAENEEEQKRKEEEELAKLDPAERAARLLAEKQRKLEEAKDSARRMESEENAGRDPCLFSKRTAFDIRFDQLEEKPWQRTGDMTDFFNYGLTEEDWLEYAQQQLTIRQELTDASRQKRPPDPNIVPVAARKPKVQTPRVAVVSKGENDDDEDKNGSEDQDENLPVIGPEMIKKEEDDGERTESVAKASPDEAADFEDVYVGEGGAWGAGAAPDSTLARLIAEQTEKENGGDPQPSDPRPPMQNIQHHHGDQQYMDGGNTNNIMAVNPHHAGEPPVMHHGGPPVDNNYDNRGHPGGFDDQSVSSYGNSSYGGADWRQNRPPSFQGHDRPPFHDDRGRFGRGRGRSRGGRGGRFNDFGGRGGRPPFPSGPGGRWGGRGGRWSGRGRDDYGYGGGGSGYYGGGRN